MQDEIQMNKIMLEPVFLKQISIQVAAAEIFLPVVTAFVEQSSLALGLEKSEALKMMLASEELFLHLCGVIIPKEGMMEIRCFRLGSFVQCDFSFPETRLNMHAFNLTASPRGVNLSDMNEMRLMLASRSVDRMDIQRNKKTIQISLIKEKKYPPIVSTRKHRPVMTCQKFEISPPSLDELKYFSLLTTSFYEHSDVFVYFERPGMLADMVQYGNFRAIIARTQRNEIAGGIVWHPLTEKLVEVIGPYVMVKDDRAKQIADSLIEACLQETGRTSAVGIICYPPASGDYSDYFEYLGHMNRYNVSGNFIGKSVWFRLIHEDIGCGVWTPPELETFLSQTYRRLFLARDIHHVSDHGDTQETHSVFSASIDKQRYQAKLDLVWPGMDMEDNLGRHLDLFKKENIRDVIFEIDTGIAWKSRMISCLLKNGFQPVYILPYAGNGDVIVFQLIVQSS